jgi:hypothetical protein
VAWNSTLSLLPAAVMACAMGLATSPRASMAVGVTRTIFASAVAKDGTPVTGLTAADFEIREGGTLQTVTSARPATTPMRVHVIVSDAGSGAFQLGVLRLVQALAGRAEFAFTAVYVQPERVMDFTDSPDRVGAGIQRLGRRGAPQGGNQLMDAIAAALKDIAAPGKHPVLIVLRVGQEDASTLPSKAVRDALRMSGATMYVVSRTGASKPVPTFAGGGSMTAAVAQREMDDTELADTARHLNAVLGDGSRESGGSDQETALTSAVPTLEQLAREIKGQYEISYTLPEGTRPSDRVQVTTRRKDVTLRAPIRLPN